MGLPRTPGHREGLVFPPWKEICAQDAERDQSFDDAVSVDGSVRARYRRCGFELVEVPRVDVERRCEFIPDRLQQQGVV